MGINIPKNIIAGLTLSDGVEGRDKHALILKNPVDIRLVFDRLPRHLIYDTYTLHTHYIYVIRTLHTRYDLFLIVCRVT